MGNQKDRHTFCGGGGGKKGGLGGSGIIQRRIKRLSLLEDIQKKSVALPDGRKGWSVSGTLSLGVSRKWQGGSPPFELPKKNLFTVPVIRLWSVTEKPYDIVEKKSVYPSFSVTILDNQKKHSVYPKKSVSKTDTSFLLFIFFSFFLFFLGKVTL